MNASLKVAVTINSCGIQRVEVIIEKPDLLAYDSEKTRELVEYLLAPRHN